MSEVGGEQDSAGTLLRRAREAAGLHVATLAVNLKVPVRKLEALEEDRYEELPDAVFVRALASSVCRTLKVDPQPVLDRLPQSSKPRLVQDDDGINTPFRAPSDGPKPGLVEQLSRPVVLTVVALLLAAVVLVFLPVVQREQRAASGAPDPVMPPGTPAVVTAAPAEPRVEAPSMPAPAPPAPSAAAPGTAAAPAPKAQAPAAASTAAAALSPTLASPTSAGSAASASATRGVVVFRTRGTSWVHVSDATGATVLRRLMEAGETAGVNGALPLSVTVGSAEATEVQVRGQPYDLAPVSRDNVARFEVK